MLRTYLAIVNVVGRYDAVVVVVVVVTATSSAVATATATAGATIGLVGVLALDDLVPHLGKRVQLVLGYFEEPLLVYVVVGVGHTDALVTAGCALGRLFGRSCRVRVMLALVGRARSRSRLRVRASSTRLVRLAVLMSMVVANRCARTLAFARLLLALSTTTATAASLVTVATMRVAFVVRERRLASRVLVVSSVAGSVATSTSTSLRFLTLVGVVSVAAAAAAFVAACIVG